MGKFYISALLKVGKKEFLEKFFNNGELYLNTLNYFKNLENDDIVGDTMEGCCELIQKSKIFTYDDNGLKEVLVEGVRGYLYDSSKNGNIFCMYSLREEEFKNNIHCIDNNVFKFGLDGIFIHNPKEFIRRVKLKCEELGYNVECNPIKYFNEKEYDGLITPFHKRDKYLYQKESRIFIPGEGIGPLSIEIGSISDIAVCIKQGGVFVWGGNENSSSRKVCIFGEKAL